MPLVAGVDSSTQSTKVVVVDRDTGAIVREGRAAHPPGTSCDPRAWLAAWRRASDGLLDGVAAISVGGQQHGMVVLDESGAPVRDALLWNDLRSAGDAEDLVRELGGSDRWISAVGSVPVAAFTVTKLRWLARHEPENAARAHRVMLPHDWLTWNLAGRPGEATTDRGDASGTGYWSPSTGEYRLDLLDLAFGRTARLPRVAAPREIVGAAPWGAVIAAGTGDNMAAALGLDAGPGDVVVSIGTSGTVFAVTDLAPRDPTGQVTGFADATGRFLPLVCTNNAAQVLTATARMLGVGLDRFTALALSAPPGAEGVTMLPYLEGERTPNRPSATAEIAGLRLGNATPPNLARAAVEAMLCGLADGLDALRGTRGVEPNRILMIGGGSRSEAVRRIAPTVFGMPVHFPRTAEYVALGAARQAAWAHGPGGEPPAWPATAHVTHDAPATPGLRDRFARLRDRRPASI